MNVLVTGGLGYIGSHIVDYLLKQTNYNIIIIDVKHYDNNIFHWDNFINQRLKIFQHDLLYSLDLDSSVDAVIHCASLKSVPESVVNPLLYYESNIMMTINLLKWMQNNRVYHLIYSSSATLYGNKCETKFKESDITIPSNPYGNTKMFCEKLLHDISQTNDKWRVLCLRYFNPAASHFDVDQGNTNLFTSIQKNIKQIAAGGDSCLIINTVDQNEDEYLRDLTDGTCVRDYIHIDDLTDGHIKSLDYLNNTSTQFDIINLGTSLGYSTLTVAKTIMKECENVGLRFSYKIGDHRPGDAAVLVSDCEKANTLLGWTPKRSLDDICQNVVSKLKYSY